jgi:hypothetical protein
MTQCSRISLSNRFTDHQDKEERVSLSSTWHDSCPTVSGRWERNPCARGEIDERYRLRMPEQVTSINRPSTHRLSRVQAQQKEAIV